MAAIVSKLAAANRKRKANKQYHIPIEKSVYVLPPFDPCFKPEVHNRYIRTKQTQLAHQELMTNIGTQFEETTKLLAPHCASEGSDIIEEVLTNGLEHANEPSHQLLLPQVEAAEETVPPTVPPAEVQLILVEDGDDRKACKIVIAILVFVAFIPLIGIFVYLFGMFVSIPSPGSSSAATTTISRQQNQQP